MNRSLLFTALLVAAIVGGFIIFDPLEGPGKAVGPQVYLDATYDAQTETVHIRHTGAEPFTAEATRSVVVLVSPASTEQPVNATIKASGVRVPNGVWAAHEPPAITRFPLENGSDVSVVSDGVDSDGDGITGIEQGDRVVVRVFFREGSQNSPRLTYLQWCAPDGDCDT